MKAQGGGYESTTGYGYDGAWSFGVLVDFLGWLGLVWGHNGQRLDDSEREREKQGIVLVFAWWLVRFPRVWVG